MNSLFRYIYLIFITILIIGCSDDHVCYEKYPACETVCPPDYLNRGVHSTGPRGKIVIYKNFWGFICCVYAYLPDGCVGVTHPGNSDYPGKVKSYRWVVYNHE